VSEKGYNMRNARVKAQMVKMQELMDRGICAFCEEHFEEYHDNPVELKTKYWIVTKNDYPYERTQLHLMLVPRVHVRTITELGQRARADMLEALVEIERRWALDSYAIGMRVGDPHWNGGTVEHLHAHVIVAERESAEHEPVRFKMSTRRGPKGG
jgi:diadenosine tetraphosphate (Ap4A) HIT family hydrolase